MISRRTVITLPVLGALPLHSAFAQDYPSKPIRIVVPIAAGTSTDGAARYMANALSKVLGGSIVVENKIGADGAIATEFVAKSPPDGYTLLTTIASHYIGPWMQKLPYDAVRDFEPIMRYAQSPIVLVVAADSPLKSVRDVIEAARQKPGQLSYATAASTSAMAAALMENLSGVKFKAVPYKSAPQSVIDTASGVVDMAFVGIAASQALLQSGRLRALGITTGKRSVILPDVPAIAESGPELASYDFASPIWIFAPRGTPPAIVNKLSEEFTRIASAPEYREFAKKQGFDVAVQDAATVRAGAAAELEKWGRLVELTSMKGS